MKDVTKISSIICIFILTTLTLVFGHDNWIYFSNIKDAKREGKIILKLCNGHNFPKSILGIDDRVINYFKAIAPDGKISSIKTIKKDKYRIGTISPLKDGTYILFAGLKRPPRYFLKAVFTIHKNNRKDFKVGEPFEITLDRSPSDLKIGDKLILQVYFNGKPVQTNLSFSIDGKSNFYTSTDKRGKYKLNIKKKGKYLITSNYKGKGCSLIFEIE